MDKANVSNNNNKNKKLATLVISLLLLFLLIIIVGVAYAKFVMTAEGTATAQVAKMICNMNVAACDSNDQTIINPYCTVTLNDYNTVNNVDKITETNVNYRVEVSPASGSTLQTLPTYYWMDSNDNIVGSASQPLTGSFTKGNKETQVYRIYFVNAGSSNFLANIDFDLIAIQESNN